MKIKRELCPAVWWMSLLGILLQLLFIAIIQIEIWGIRDAQNEMVRAVKVLQTEMASEYLDTVLLRCSLPSRSWSHRSNEWLKVQSESPLLPVYSESDSGDEHSSP